MSEQAALDQFVYCVNSLLGFDDSNFEAIKEREEQFSINDVKAQLLNCVKYGNKLKKVDDKKVAIIERQYLYNLAAAEALSFVNAKENEYKWDSKLKPIADKIEKDYLEGIYHESAIMRTEVLTFLVLSGKIIPSVNTCLLYTSPSPRDATLSRMPSSA